MSDIRFDGKVAIVTGAGNGLGKSYALLLASKGAKVVINNLGDGLKGDAGNNQVHPADAVVAQIKAAGGQAVANKDSVEHGEMIVKTAVDAFGTFDIVINYPNLTPGCLTENHEQRREGERAGICWSWCCRLRIVGSQVREDLQYDVCLSSKG